MAGIADTSWYRLGKVSAVKGNTKVTGIGTGWLLAGINPGATLRFFGDPNGYEIAQVTSDTEIELAAPYDGETVSAATYSIDRNFQSTVPAELASKMTRLLKIYEQLYNGTMTTIQGLSAYQLAVAGGYTGTVAEWLESLKGLSAYQIAKANGYTGTEAEWLDYLHDGAGLQALSARVDGLSDVMTVKKLRVGRLYTPCSVLNSYYNVEPNHLKDGTKSLFLTFPTSYKYVVHYHYNLRVHLHDQWGIDNRLSQKTLEYKATSGGYRLQIVQSLSDDSPAITVEDNCVYLTPGYNGTGHIVYAYADVEQLSDVRDSTERSRLFYTVNEELFREMTEYLWN